VGGLVSLGIFLMVLTGSMIRRRAYCRLFCPLGETLLLGQLAADRVRGKRSRVSAGRASSSSTYPLFNRRGFLGLASLVSLGSLVRSADAEDALRPPGALSEPLFSMTCVRCGQCFAACPTGAIVPSRFEGGVRAVLTPRLDLAAGPCLPGCIVCEEACPSGALEVLDPERRRTWKIGLASVQAERCLRSRGKECCVCKEACPYNALTYPVSSPTALPVLEPNLCIGCGICEHACPARGGIVVRREEQV